MIRRVARNLAPCLALLSMSSGAWATSLMHGDLGVDGTNYLFQGSPKQENMYSTFQGEWAGRSTGPVLEASLQGQAWVMLNSQGVYAFEAPEAYLGTSPELGPVRLSVGRKLESWNHLDDFWKLGIWQPRFRWDYLEPDTVGMAGGFVTVDTPYFKVVGFASPGFIPDRGAPIDVHGGKLSSPSPWFQPPSSQIALFDTNTRVRYNLVVPNTMDVISHPAGSLLARAGAADRGPWAQASYAYKPMNQLPMAFEGYLNLDTLEADVNLYPRVMYHHLTSLESGFNSEPVNVWISLLNEHPVRDSTPAGWTTQEFADSQALSSAIDWKFAHWGESPSKLDFGYLRQWGGNAPDQGPQATGGTSIFDSRYPYQSAFMVAVESPFPRAVGSWGSRVVGSSRVLYDIGHDGTIWSTDVRYRPHDSWSLGIGADLLSSGTLPGQGDDFIYRYRANDRVRAGVTYVF